MLGLEERQHHHPNQLSGGQQQRVAIARALVNDAPLLLADEPTGNLDTKTSMEIMELFVRLNAEKKITIVLVTHEPDISAFSKRIIRFLDGKIVSDRGEQTMINLPSTVKISLRALRVNKMRSALTMLGIIIGVAAVITMLAVGKGASNKISEQIATVGSNLIIVIPGSTTTGGIRLGSGAFQNLTRADAEAIKNECSAVSTTAPDFKRQRANCLRQSKLGNRLFTERMKACWR